MLFDRLGLGGWIDCRTGKEKGFFRPSLMVEAWVVLLLYGRGVMDDLPPLERRGVHRILGWVRVPDPTTFGRWLRRVAERMVPLLDTLPWYMVRRLPGCRCRIRIEIQQLIDYSWSVIACGPIPHPAFNGATHMTDSGTDRTITLKTAVDLDVVGENILDIADFAIEKHEYRHDTKLSAEQREAAAAQIREALWKLVEAFKARRKRVLQRMFEVADQALEKALSDK